jgi:hypothetical protein
MSEIRIINFIIHVITPIMFLYKNFGQNAELYLLP